MPPTPEEIEEHQRQERMTVLERRAEALSAEMRAKDLTIELEPHQWSVWRESYWWEVHPTMGTRFPALFFTEQAANIVANALNEGNWG